MLTAFPSADMTSLYTHPTWTAWQFR